ncbi:hypothetical protein ACFL47_05370 [Candidatus Latescibacterota bacterium]
MAEGTEEVIPEDIISDELKIHAKSQLTEKADKIQQYFNFKNLSHDKAVDLLNSEKIKQVNITHDIKNVVNEILNEMSMIGAPLPNTALFKTKDAYHMDHALNVTVLTKLLEIKY